MNVVDDLRDLVNAVKDKIEATEFEENDVRKAYFENLYSVLNQFYIGKVFYELSKEIKEGNIIISPNISHLNNHILRIYEIADHPLLSQSHQFELNRKIFADTFTNFESTIDFCFSNLVKDDQLDLIVEDINIKVFKICTEGADQKAKLLEHFRKSTFIPLIRKFRFLSKYRAECYTDNHNEDLSFIEFCVKLRNCVLHSSGYYKGKDFDYEFENITFIFKNEEFLEMQGVNDLVFVKINERLTKIIEKIFICLTDVDFIKYPDDGF